MADALTLPCLRRKSQPKVLFLTTEPPANIRLEWPLYQNWTLPQDIRERGAKVDLRCWRNSGPDVSTVAAYDIVTFLFCNNYHEHPKTFSEYVQNVLVPAQKLNPKIHVFNDPSLVLWNIDKHYLLDLANAGFRLPRTTFLQVGQHTRPSLIFAIRSFSGARPVVLKPAISGSAKRTHLIEHPDALTQQNERFIDRVLSEGSSCDLVVQEYEGGISLGEYSLVYVNGIHTHTILKTPRTGEFRCQDEFGGSTKEIRTENVPQDARDTAQNIMRYLEAAVEKTDNRGKDLKGKGLVYARIDGIMKGDVFLLMEVEAIEPHLWLEVEGGTKAFEELCKVFFPARKDMRILKLENK